MQRAECFEVALREKGTIDFMAHSVSPDCLEKRWLTGDLIIKYLRGWCEEVGSRLFSVVPRGNGQK